MGGVRREAGGKGWARFLIAVSACMLLANVSYAALAQTNVPQLLRPSALAYDAGGNLYIADAGRNQVLEATLAGAVEVVAGTGTQGFSGDNGPATQAELNGPQGLVFGSDGTLYIADTGNARIRAVNSGMIATFAGTGIPGYSGDGGAATSAEFRSPTALAVDEAGALLVCDASDHRIRRISSGVVTTFAGTGVQGFAGDGGPAADAELDWPSGIAVGADGRVFIADTHNNRVRVVAADASISTYAGNGQRGFAGDGGPASTAELSGPRGLTFGADGSLLVADADDRRVRSISPAGVISTLMGSGVEGLSRDGTVAAQAALHGPRILALSSFGLPALADSLNGTVWLLTTAGTLYSPAGFASDRSSSVQPAWAASQMYGQVTLSATVNGSVGVPYGTVAFSEDGATIASASLNAGVASVNTPTLNAGTHNLIAVYGGDGLNPARSGPSVSVTVLPAPVSASANEASVVYGLALPALTGTLTGVLAQDSGQVTAVFTAALPNPLTAGTYPIGASLTGPAAGNYTVSMSPNSGSLKITQAGSITAVGTIAQSYTGLPLRLTASVAAATSGQPTGTVQFLDGGTVVASAPLENGSASGVYVSPPAGTRSITAQYGGDANFKPSTSAVVQASISALPDFAISPSGSATATVAAGGTATYTVQVSSASSPFTGVVVLSAAGLPQGATATFSPVQVVPGASAAAVTVNIQTPVAQALGIRPGRTRTQVTVAAFALLCLTISRRRRRKLVWLLGAALWICGCGARTVGEGPGGITSQSYAVQVTGTSTNLVGAVVAHTTSLTLVVQQ